MVWNSEWEYNNQDTLNVNVNEYLSQALANI